MKITATKLQAFQAFLRSEERSDNTCKKYARDLQAFAQYLNGQAISKVVVLEWKEELCKTYAPASVNSMLAAVNGFFSWAEAPQFRVKSLKIQRSLFAKPEKELSRAEYSRLVQAAEESNNVRLSLLLQTICATGIRVSELCFVTVAAVRNGRAVVTGKGKMRTVLLPKALCRSLRAYCGAQGLRDGVVFRTAAGAPMDRSNIWRDMKTLCQRAGVETGKVFPHNLRHLFARTFYSLEKDISRLADLLGHASVNTTRIYTMESGHEHARQLARMGLVFATKIVTT